MTDPHNKPSDIEVRARLSHPLVHAGEPAEIFLRVDVTGRGELGTRPPLDLAVVLDRSGSMEGSKIAFAKKAVDILIDRLLPSDHLSLITYDSVVETVFPRRRVDDALVMKTKVELIGPRGCTNLSGGLVKGLQELGRDGGALRRVLLLSDGLANEGVTDLAGLSDIARQGVAAGKGVSTFGVGVDFNEELLRMLADAGGGTYYYIASPDDIPAIFLEELGELGDVVAQNLSIDFRAKGVEILGVLGFDGAGLPASAGDVRAGAVRSVMLALAVPPTAEGEVVLGEVVCRWTALGDVTTGEEARITVSAVNTTDLKRVQEAVDQDVLRAAQLQLVADEHQAASQAAKARDEAAHRMHLARARKALESIGDTDDPLYQEQLLLSEEIRARGTQALMADLDFQKRIHDSQYRIRRGKPARESERWPGQDQGDRQGRR